MCWLIYLLTKLFTLCIYIYIYITLKVWKLLFYEKSSYFIK